MRQFQNHPLVEFELNGKKILTTNFFIHFTLREILKDNSNFLATYTVSADERPDIVAEKLYGDSDLAWLVLMANDIVDPTDEWVKNTTNFNNYLDRKYPTEKEQSEIAFTTYNGRVAHYEATSRLNDNNSPFGTQLSQKDTSATDITKYADTTVGNAENLINESRRVIKVIKKDYIKAVQNEIKKKIKSAGAK